MSFTLIVNGSTITTSNINQVVNALQQPSGGSETGSYHVANNGYAVGAFVSDYQRTLSQGSTPVSVSLDLSGGSISCTTPTTSNLSSKGFFSSATATAIATNIAYGGAWTVSY